MCEPRYFLASVRPASCLILFCFSFVVVRLWAAKLHATQVGQICVVGRDYSIEHGFRVLTAETVIYTKSSIWPNNQCLGALTRIFTWISKAQKCTEFPVQVGKVKTSKKKKNIFFAPTLSFFVYLLYRLRTEKRKPKRKQKQAEKGDVYLYICLHAYLAMHLSVGLSAVSK